MTFSSPQIIRAKAEASIEQAQTAFWFPVLPGLQALPGTPTITTNGSPAPANAVAVPAGFNEDNPDLVDLFTNILPKGQAPVFPRTMGPAAGLIVPPYNEIQTWEARIRVPAEAVLLPFSNEIVYVAAATLKVLAPASITDRLGVSSQVLTITGSAAGLVNPPNAGSSSRALAITGTASGTVRLAGASSRTLAITGSATGTVVTPVTPQRYWRMNQVTLSGASNFDIGEIQLFNGATQQTGATVTASSPPVNGIGELTDGNLTSSAYWSVATATDSGFFIRWDFGAGNEKSVNGVKMAGGFNDDDYPTGLRLQYSSDNTSWTTLGSASGLTSPGYGVLSSLITVS